MAESSEQGQPGLVDPPPVADGVNATIDDGLFKKRGKKKKKSKKMKKRTFSQFSENDDASNNDNNTTNQDNNRNNLDSNSPDNSNDNNKTNNSKNKNSDNEDNEDDDDDNLDITSIAKKRRKIGNNGTTFATTKVITRNEINNSNNNNNNKSNSNDIENEQEYGYSATFSYKSDKSIVSHGAEDQGAAVELLSRIEHAQQSKQKSHVEKMPERDEKGRELYQGLKGYAKNDPGTSRNNRDKSKKDNKPAKYLGIGPLRAPDNVKITCRFDYQPDVCKDWKETGYCGYGQSCKFLHDRSDYKSGWQIENEWNEAQKRKQERLSKYGQFGNDKEENYEIHSDNDDEDSDIDEDGLPFACHICRKEFIDPIVTKCGHYFCEKCATKRFRKTQLCAICNAKTEGTFQTAEKLIQKLNKRKKNINH